MTETIRNTLAAIERERDVRILLAVESGSRAWGFASPDSDYDVRIIYVRPRDRYLLLEPERDVIELPISETLDVNGWDLDKTLRLLRRSNPTLFEWLGSPIVYLRTTTADGFRPLLERYFSPRQSMLHYLSMARRNFDDHLRGETVKAKKYFYVLRPVLACRWILDRGTPPPVLFSELAAAELDSSLRPAVDRLLDIKINAPEVRAVPRVTVLHDYLVQSMEETSRRLEALPRESVPGWEPLDDFFRKVLAEGERPERSPA